MKTSKTGETINKKTRIKKELKKLGRVKYELQNKTLDLRRILHKSSTISKATDREPFLYFHISRQDNQWLGFKSSMLNIGINYLEPHEVVDHNLYRYVC